MKSGERIRHIRGRLSRESFASRIGVDKSTVQRYETENSIPKGDILLNIRREFSVDLNWLLTGDGQPYAHSQPSPAAHLCEGHGMWGHTRSHEVEGERFTVTLHGSPGPQQTGQPPLAETAGNDQAAHLGHAVALVSRILGSGDKSAVEALFAFLVSLADTLDRRARAEEKIRALEKELETQENASRT